MKKIFMSAVLLSAMGLPAQAAPNNTPHALSCMAKNGFTHDMWVAHRAGTDQQVQSYIQCRDGGSSSKALATGRKSGAYSRGY